MSTSLAYPVHVNAALDPKLSRWLWLVKWILVLPHHIVLAFLWIGFAVTSVVAFFAILFTKRYPRAIFDWSDDSWQWNLGAGGGLVGILVCISALILAFTGAYPRGLYDVILGMNRWALRVAGYAGLMTDAYPPFRLDLGGSDPTLVALPASGNDAPPSAAADAGAPGRG